MDYKFAFEEQCIKQIGRKKKAPGIDANDVVLVRMDLIGDCTMFTSTAYAIREYYKDRKMSVICLESSKNVFERMGVFDDVISINIKPDNVNKEIAIEFLNIIKHKRADIVLQPQASRYPISDVICAAISANHRIAISLKLDNCGEEWKKYDDVIFDQFIEYPDNIRSEFDYYSIFARGLGIKAYKSCRPRLPVKKQNIVNGKYFVLFPGGTLSVKFWPAEKYAMIADYIYKKTGYLCVVLGTQSEQWIFDQIRKNADPRTKMDMLNLMGKTTISDVIDIIGGARLVISNDTSGIHIACATNVPSVALVGGWHYGRFLPYELEEISSEDNIPLVANKTMSCYGCDWDRNKIRLINRDCISDLNTGKVCQCIDIISVEKVQGLVDRIIEQNGKE